MSFLFSASRPELRGNKISERFAPCVNRDCGVASAGQQTSALCHFGALARHLGAR
jgi:hypothetical protein